MTTRDDPPGYDPPGLPPAPPEPSRLSYVISALVAAALFAAIVGGDLLLTGHHHHYTTAAGPTGATSATTPATPNPTTTSTAAAAGGATSGDIPAASATPPSLAAAYTPDPVLVLKTLSTYIDWVFAHPDPSLVANFMLTSDPHYGEEMSQLQTLMKNGWHDRPSVTEIVFAKAYQPFEPAPVTLNGHPGYEGTSVKVVTNITPQANDVLNSAGQVVSSFTTPAQGFLVISIAQGPDGRFRISDSLSVHPPGGISAFES